MVWGTNVWVAGSISFAEIGKIEGETRIFFGSRAGNQKFHFGPILDLTEMPIRHLCEDISSMLELWEEDRLLFQRQRHVDAI